jgi:pyruvate carboxylase
MALQRMDRALREFRIRGVKTNIPFLENVIGNEKFRSGQATTTLIDTTPELFQFKPRRDRATKLLNFLGDVIVNGNPQAKGYRPGKPPARSSAPVPAFDRKQSPPPGTRQLLLKLGPKKFAEWTLKQKQPARHGHDLPRRAPIALGHPRAHLRHAGRGRRHRPAHAATCSAWKCGAARPSTPPCVSCTKTRGSGCASCASAFPNICFQMLFRGSNAVGYSNYPDNVVAGFVKHAAGGGHGYFPHLRFAELHAESQGGDGSGAGNARHLRSGDLLHRRHPRPGADKYSLKYYVKLARELEKWARTFPGDQGHGRPVPSLCAAPAGQGAEGGNRPADPFPHARHERASTPPRAEASEAGVDVVDLAIASMSGSTSQPNLNSIVAALQHTPARHRPGFGALNEFSIIGSRSAPIIARSTPRRATGSAEVYLHEMPGGQYTNLKEQAAAWAWPIAGRKSRAPTPRSTSFSATS